MPVCLTLTMVKTSGYGWTGAELFVFKERNYKEGNVYDCPETCRSSNGWTDRCLNGSQLPWESSPLTPSPRLTLHSCDYVDYVMGIDPDSCDDRGANITGTCDCKSCVCSGWDPSPGSYESRHSLESGYSSTEEVCFDQVSG